MKTRTKRIAGLAAVGVLVGGGIAGAVAATSQGDPAGDLASALSKETGAQVSADQVKAAYQDVLKQRLDQDVASGRLTQDQADQILKQAANAPGLPGMGGPGDHRGGMGGPGGMHRGPGNGAVDKAIAKSLGITEAEWQKAEQAGKSAAEVAKGKGVDTADVVSAVQAALKANKPQGAPSMTDAQLKQFAEHIVNDAHHGPGGRDRHGDMGPGGPPPGMNGAPPQGQAPSGGSTAPGTGTTGSGG